MEDQPKRLSTEIAVEDVRAGLQVFHLSAAFGGWRVAIVDSADELNPNSANALLKTVEEPPERALILLVSHRPGQILPTIRSRCRQLRLDPLTEDEVVSAVTGLGVPSSQAGHAAIAAAARRADGSVRQALVRLAPDSGGAGALIDEVVAGLPRPDPRTVARLAEAVGGRAGDEAYLAFHRELYGWFVGTRETSRRDPRGWKRSGACGIAFATPSGRRRRSISTGNCIFWRSSPRSRRPRRGGDGRLAIGVIGRAPPPPCHSPSRDGRPSGRPIAAREEKGGGAVVVLPCEAGEGDRPKDGGGGDEARRSGRSSEGVIFRRR